jgi:hypothetical protein
MINVTPSSSIRVIGVGEEYRVSDLLKMVDERDALRVQVEELKVRTSFDGYRELGARVAAAEDERDDLRARVTEIDHLRARLAALESPPVVPAGYRVELHAGSWRLVRDPGLVLTPSLLAAAYRALAYAIETDQYPPHVGDEKP